MIAIIDYNAGNLTSVLLAFEALGLDARITNDPSVILSAERVVFPGVGAAGAAMASLNKLGLIPAINKVVEKKTPLLGICLGTQIIFQRSDENDGVECLGLLPGTVKHFQPSDPMCKVPQMGWNSVSQIPFNGTTNRTHPLFEGIENNSEFYFVHSYYPAPAEKDCVLGRTEYADTTFASVVCLENIVATQFHPEKSGRIGLQLLSNFSKWSGI